MLLIVDHLTRYRYDLPVRGVVQSHKLTPASFQGQKVLEWQVTVSGGAQGGGFRDGAGDWIQSWTVAGPVSDISVHVQGRVETTDMSGILKGHRESVPPEAWVRDTEATEPDAAILALAAAVSGMEPLAAAHALALAVSQAIAYRPGTTHVHTTAAAALAQGEGVCQDHAQVLISAARAAGFPARYVSGYLFADAEGESHDAAHAWAELYLQGFGWIGFDPANECCPDERYIRLGSGLDAAEAAPIRGVSRGSGEESLSVTVAVQTQEQ